MSRGDVILRHCLVISADEMHRLQLLSFDCVQQRLGKGRVFRVMPPKQGLMGALHQQSAKDANVRRQNDSPDRPSGGIAVRAL